MSPIRWLLLFISGILRDRTELALENLALRQQLAALRYQAKRPRVRKRDRVFWAILSRIWTNWRSALLIVQPDTVVRWHRQGFRLFWRWKSRSGRFGRPSTEAEVRRLIRRMSRENATWGVPRIQSEPRVARARGVRSNRAEVQGSNSEATVADLANIPRQSPDGHRRNRLLHRSYGYIPCNSSAACNESGG